MEGGGKNETEKRERKTPNYLSEYETSGIKDLKNFRQIMFPICKGFKEIILIFRRPSLTF